MQSSKHERDASDDAVSTSKLVKVEDVASSSSSNAAAAPSLAGFWQLPQELRTLIFDLACHSQLKAGKTASNISGARLLCLDSRVVAKLALISREFHATFNPQLYSRVYITRPSVLKAFLQGLLLSPPNASLVDSLHLGPASALVKEGWPISIKREGAVDETNEARPERHKSVVLIKTSLSKRDNAQGLLPRWAEPDRDFAVRQPPQNCQERAVAAAIDVALDTIDINPWEELSNARGQHINIVSVCRIQQSRLHPLDAQNPTTILSPPAQDRWTMRLFELQAVLDLYLGAMRRIEEAGKYRVQSWRSKKKRPNHHPARCLSGSCSHYPKVVLKGFDRSEHAVGIEESTAAPNNKVKTAETDFTHNDKVQLLANDGQRGRPDEIVITRAEVKAHMARRGAYTDHFEHPLQYARTNMQMLGLSASGKVIVDYNHEQRHEHYESSDDGFSFDDDLSEEYSDSELDSADGARHDESLEKATPTSTASSRVSMSSSCGVSSGLIIDPTNRHRTFAIACETLRLTKDLKNLSLTGYFNNCLNSQSLASLDDLLYLSIGPLAPPLPAEPWLKNLRLPAVKKLRICGQSISNMVKEIARQDCDANWPNLETLHWDFAHYIDITSGTSPAEL